MKKAKYFIILFLNLFLIINVQVKAQNPGDVKIPSIPSGYEIVECEYNDIILVFGVKNGKSKLYYGKKIIFDESGYSDSVLEQMLQTYINSCQSEGIGDKNFCEQLFFIEKSKIYYRDSQVKSDFIVKSASDCPKKIINDGQKYIVSSYHCGNIENIPKKIPELTSWAVTFIQVLVPVILVIMSMVDLIKAITSQKEDEIKKGQKVLIKRIVLAAIIFLFVALVKFVISIVANSTDTNNIVSCISCFIDGNCK